MARFIYAIATLALTCLLACAALAAQGGPDRRTNPYPNLKTNQTTSAHPSQQSRDSGLQRGQGPGTPTEPAKKNSNMGASASHPPGGPGGPPKPTKKKEAIGGSAPHPPGGSRSSPEPAKKDPNIGATASHPPSGPGSPPEPTKKNENIGAEVSHPPDRGRHRDDANLHGNAHSNLKMDKDR